jgi:hypothetical protein
MKYEQESDLVNVPSKVFYQGDFPEGERPIIMNFYQDCIELDQQDCPKILISNDNLEKFIKSLRKGFAVAEKLRH